MSDGQGEAGAAAGGAAGAGVLTGEEAAAAAAAAGGAADQGGAAEGAAGDDGKGNDGGAAAWYASLSADKPADGKLSDKEWLETKKYEGLPQLVQAHRQLETLLSSEKVPLPKGEDDKDGWNRVFKALGRPDSAEGYKLDALEGADDGLVKAFAGKAHELGLTQKQLEGAVAWNMAMAQEQQEKLAQRDKADVAALRASLGADYGATLDKTYAAGLALGLTDDQLTGLRKELGPKALVTMLQKVGAAIGEDKLIGGDQRGGKTLDQMLARKQEIMTSPELAAKLRNKDAALTAEWNDIAAAEAQAMKAQRAA